MRRTLAQSPLGCRGDAHVRFGSKADICSASTYVRFTPDNDRESGFPHKVMSALPVLLHHKTPRNRDGAVDLPVYHQRPLGAGCGQRQTNLAALYFSSRCPPSRENECPLWVKSGHFAVQSPCPLYPRQRFSYAGEAGAIRSLKSLKISVHVRSLW